MQKLTRAEEEIMQMFWDHGECTVSDLIALMDEPKPPHSSISSIARILERKGFINHKPAGRSFIYFAVIDKKDYSRHSIRSLVSNYFEGSMNELVSFLVREEDLTLTELNRLDRKFKAKKNDYLSTSSQPLLGIFLFDLPFAFSEGNFFWH